MRGNPSSLCTPSCTYLLPDEKQRGRLSHLAALAASGSKRGGESESESKREGARGSEREREGERGIERELLDSAQPA